MKKKILLLLAIVTIASADIQIGQMKIKNPVLSLQYLSVEHGGTKAMIDAYSDGIGVVVVGNPGIKADNEAVNKLVFKYGEKAKEASTSLPDYVLANGTPEDKILAQKIKDDLAASQYLQEGELCPGTTDEIIINGKCAKHQTTLITLYTYLQSTVFKFNKAETLLNPTYSNGLGSLENMLNYTGNTYWNFYGINTYNINDRLPTYSAIGVIELTKPIFLQNFNINSAASDRLPFSVLVAVSLDGVNYQEFSLTQFGFSDFSAYIQKPVKYIKIYLSGAVSYKRPALRLNKTTYYNY